eukprot:1216714-Amphidinium_carterae.1
MQDNTSQSPPSSESGGDLKGNPPTCLAEGPGFHSFDHALSSLVATAPGLAAHPSLVWTARSQTLVEPLTHLNSLLGDSSAASLTNFSQLSFEAFCLALVEPRLTVSKRTFWLAWEATYSPTTDR